ncbi:MAG: hypothetical protein M1816_002882 [Peltula sp. TS41687]|nr:MAG: hypothetical protein M1816_002882 [Peltula sp. TS41687]
MSHMHGRICENTKTINRSDAWDILVQQRQKLQIISRKKIASDITLSQPNHLRFLSLLAPNSKMRTGSLFAMSILLVVAAFALPGRRPKDLSSWATYTDRSPHPPFPPPDIGPRELPKDILRRYPGLTEQQKWYLSVKQRRLHDKALAEIAKKARLTRQKGGTPSPPSDAELDETREAIGQQMEGTASQLHRKTTGPLGMKIIRAPPPSLPLAQIERELAELRERRSDLLRRMREARKIAREATQTLGRVQRESERQFDRKGVVRPASEAQAKLVETARKDRAKALIEIEEAVSENNEMSPRILDLKEQLRRTKYYEKLHYPLPDFKPDPKPDSSTSHEDEQNLAVTATEADGGVDGGNKQPEWIRRASDSLKGIIHQFSMAAQRAGSDTHFMPYGVNPPKLGPVGIY